MPIHLSELALFAFAALILVFPVPHRTLLRAQRCVMGSVLAALAVRFALPDRK